MSANPGRVILLVYGEPGNGKSFLAERLKTKYSFAVLSVDEAYEEFIRVHCPMLYFEALEYYIGPHYYAILADREYSRAQLGRDFVAEWHSHLNNCIKAMTARHEKVVVEGGLLRECMNLFEAGLKSLAQVFQIEVIRGRFRIQGSPVSLTQIAALGQSTTNPGVEHGPAA
jgi:dephospho-CoA kinase